MCDLGAHHGPKRAQPCRQRFALEFFGPHPSNPERWGLEQSRSLEYRTFRMTVGNPLFVGEVRQPFGALVVRHDRTTKDLDRRSRSGFDACGLEEVNAVQQEFRILTVGRCQNVDQAVVTLRVLVDSRPPFEGGEEAFGFREPRKIVGVAGEGDRNLKSRPEFDSLTEQVADGDAEVLGDALRQRNCSDVEVHRARMLRVQKIKARD